MIEKPRIPNLRIKRFKIKSHYWLLLFGVLAIGLLFSSVETVAFMTTENDNNGEKSVVIASYSHEGVYDYLIHLEPNTVYNKTFIQSHEGEVFSSLVQSINGSFSYQLLTHHPVKATGSYNVKAYLQTNYWEKQYHIVKPTSFSIDEKSRGFITEFPIDYEYYQQVVSSIEQETNVNVQDAQLHLICSLSLDGTIAEEPFSTSFSPELTMSLRGSIIHFSEQLTHIDEGTISTTQTISSSSEQNETMLLPTSGILFFSLVGLLVFTARETENKVSTHQQYQKIQKKYHDFLVDIDKPPAQHSETIMVSCIDDLMKLSEQVTAPILHYHGTRTKDNHFFYVLHNSHLYQFTLSQDKKIHNATVCPQCHTSVGYEGFPGEQIKLQCPTCGNRGVISLKQTQMFPCN